MIDAELGDWVDRHVRAAGRARTGPLTLFRERAWATVYSAATDGGTVWLKVAAPENAFEAGLYEVLVDVVPERVLTPLGTDAARGWILLPYGGTSAGARAGDDDGAATEALAAALPSYAQLQQALAPHAARMLRTGLVDLTPAAMPEAFDDAVATVAPYAAGRIDLDQLLARRGTFARWCAELEAYGRPATLDHNDLHAWNVLEGPRFYDWGDSVLAHPFAALLTPLNGVPDEQGARLRDAYLAEWGAPRELRAEAELAVLVANVARALVWHRALGPRPGEHEHADHPFHFLRRLISASP